MAFCPGAGVREPFPVSFPSFLVAHPFYVAAFSVNTGSTSRTKRILREGCTFHTVWRRAFTNRTLIDYRILIAKAKYQP